MYPVYALYHYYPHIFWGRIALTLVILSVGAAGIIILYQKGKLTRRTRNTAMLWWAYVLFLLYITVIGRYAHIEVRAQIAPFESYRLCFETGNTYELEQIMLNILIFVPFGVLSAALFREKNPLLTALPAGIALTVLIEFLQWITRTGTIETDDLIHNTLGVLLGILIWRVYIAIRKKIKEKRSSQ